MTILSATGEIEWQVEAKQPQDCWRLPNGNILFANYLGHGQLGEQPQFFEITPDKKVVWAFEDKGRFKTINQIMALDDKGDVTRGEVLR